MSIYNTPFGLFYIVYSAFKYSYYIYMEYTDILKKIAFNIKVERMKKELTQAELAEIINVHEKYIGKIETGKQNLTLKTLFKISQALNVQIENLLK